MKKFSPKRNQLKVAAILCLGILLSVSLFFVYSKDLVEVVVATQTVRGNMQITSSMVTTKKIDKEFLPQNYIEAQYIDEVIDRYTDIGFSNGAVLTTDNVATGEGNRASVIPEGYTVMNVSIDTLPQGIVAGDKVNIVIGSVTDSQGKTVLTYQDITVASVVKDKDGVISGIEVLVTPAQAQKIAYAQLNGSIIVSLLPNGYASQDLPVVDEGEFMNTQDAGVQQNTTQQSTTTQQQGTNSQNSQQTQGTK